MRVGDIPLVPPDRPLIRPATRPWTRVRPHDAFRGGSILAAVADARFLTQFRNDSTSERQ